MLRIKYLFVRFVCKLRGHYTKSNRSNRTPPPPTPKTHINSSSFAHCAKINSVHPLLSVTSCRHLRPVSVHLCNFSCLLYQYTRRTEITLSGLHRAQIFIIFDDITSTGLTSFCIINLPKSIL